MEPSGCPNNELDLPVHSPNRRLSTLPQTAVSPTRLYAAICMMGLRRNVTQVTKKRMSPSRGSESGSYRRRYLSASISSPRREVRISKLKIPTQLSSTYKTDFSKNLSSLLQYRLLIQHIVQLAPDRCADVSEVSQRFLLPSECVCSILDVFQAVHLVKRAGSEFSRYPHQNLIEFASSLVPTEPSYSLPSIFDNTTSYSTSFGLLPRDEEGCPFSVNPRFYDVPFTPGEAPQITQQRVIPLHLPRRDKSEANPSQQAELPLRWEKSFDSLPLTLWTMDLFHPAIIRRVTTSVITVLLQSGCSTAQSLLDRVASEEVCHAVHVSALLRFILYVLHECGIVTSSEWDFERLDTFSPDVAFNVNQQLYNVVASNQTRIDDTEKKMSVQSADSKTQLLCHMLLSQSFADPQELSPIVESLFGTDAAPSYSDMEDVMLCSVKRTLKTYREFLNLSRQ